MSEQGASRVAAYISAAIERSGKTQGEIAAEAGFPRSSVLSMIKQGQTKMPLARIPQMARALEVDPLEFLRLALGEYMPELLATCDEMYGYAAFNDAERELVARLRERHGGPLRMTPALRRALEQWLEAGTEAMEEGNASPAGAGLASRFGSG